MLWGSLLINISELHGKLSPPAGDRYMLGGMLLNAVGVGWFITDYIVGCRKKTKTLESQL